MNIPLLKACDIPNREESSHPYVIHSLKDIVREGLYIPKSPHRHSFYQILYIKRGKGAHTVDFHDVPISDDMIFFLSPGQVHDLHFSEEAPEGILVNFRERFLNDFLARKNFVDSLPIFSKNGGLCYRHITSCKSDIETAFSKILIAETSDIVFREEFIATMLLEIILMVSIRTQEENPEFSPVALPQLVLHFEELIEKYYHEFHLPRFYADYLAVSPNYLNSVCRNATEKTAGEMIRSRIILEAKRLLVNSGMDISQIAYELGFEDLSYFTKFFKAAAGMPPKQFRKSLHM